MIAGGAACSWVNSESTTPEATPATTPADVPDPLTPLPVTTPTPDPDETPTPTPPDETPVAVRQVLRVAGEEPSRADYGLPASAVCHGLVSVLAGLVRVSPQFDVEPDWAESWDEENDGATWIFHIREHENGWSSGEPVTAHDFVRAWQRVLDPASGSPLAPMLYDIVNARDVHSGDLPVEDLGISALDDWTLRVELERTRFSFPAVTASPLLSPFAGPEIDDTIEGPDDMVACIANGPYEIAETREDGLVLVPLRSYWDTDAVSLDRVEVSFMTPSGALSQFQRQGVDVVRVGNPDLPRARADGRFSDYLRRGVATSVWCLIPQIDIEPFDDIRVRRALGRVIDRRRLELIVEGRVVESSKLIPSGLFQAFDSASPEFHLQYDVDAALEELDETPYADPAMWPEFEMAIPEGDTYRERIARDVLDQIFENLGVEVRLLVLERGEYEEGLRQRRFPLTWIEWTYRYPDPSCGYADLFASWSHAHRPMAWQDAGYDELARLADAMDDPDERADIYARCEELLQERGVYIPLVHPVEHFLVQPWVTGVPTNGRGRLVQPGPFFTRFSTSMTIVDRS